MRIDNLPFTITDWAAIVATERPGQTGTVTQRTLEDGNVRVRLVEYSPGYLADEAATQLPQVREFISFPRARVSGILRRLRAELRSPGVR